MSALRRAVEVDFKEKDKHKSQGIYLLTTGIPDQETVSIFTGFTVLLQIPIRINLSFIFSSLLSFWLFFIALLAEYFSITYL